MTRPGTTDQTLFSVELEKRVTGAALIDPSLFASLELAPADFHDSRHKAIWAVAVDLNKIGLLPNFGTLSDELERRGKLQAVGGIAYLTECANECVSVMYAAQDGGRLRDLAARRGALPQLSDLAKTLYNATTFETFADRVSALNQACQFHVNALGNRGSQRQTEWTSDELLHANFPEVRWLIDRYLPIGLTVLGGRRKIGKSWLALQIAGAIGTGGKVFDQDVAKANVLYLALEDTGRRLQDRMKRQQWPSGAAVRFVTAWDPLDSGGLVSLQTEVTRLGYGLVVIDTLSRAISRRPDQNAVGDMTAVMGTLQRLAQDCSIGILVLDHHNKLAGSSGSQDPVDDLLGSSAKGAVADCLIGLYRERRKKTAKLVMTGREVEDREASLQFDRVTCCWQLTKDDSDDTRRLTAKEQEIIDTLHQLGPMPAARIARVTGQERSNCHKVLTGLVDEGVIEREGDIYKCS